MIDDELNKLAKIVRTQSDPFEKILGDLSEMQNGREAQRIADARANYDEWAGCITLLRTNFEAAGKLGKIIVENLPCWKASGIACANNPLKVMHLDGCGYQFEFALLCSESIDDRNVRKVISIQCGTGSKHEGLKSGLGDERDFCMSENLRIPKDHSLVGFDAITSHFKLSGDDLIKSSEKMLQKLRSHPVRIYVIREGSQQENGVFKINLMPEVFKEMPLDEMVKKLFMLLNQDEFQPIQDYFSNAETSPKDVSL